MAEINQQNADDDFNSPGYKYHHLRMATHASNCIVWQLLHRKNTQWTAMDIKLGLEYLINDIEQNQYNHRYYRLTYPGLETEQ